MRVAAPQGSFDAFVARPATRPTPAVVVLHEVFGVNADLRATCIELAQAGFLAICPELFWRQKRGVDLSVRSEPDWQKGLALYEAFDLNAGVRDVEATVAAARKLPEASGRVGVMGFCLGGLLAYLTAARTVVDAAVAFHGGRTEDFLNEAADVDSPLQMHLAAEDEFMSKDAQARIKAAFADNKCVEIHSYARCRHAFSRHDGMHFDAAAAQLSRARTIEFFHRTLGSP